MGYCRNKVEPSRGGPQSIYTHSKTNQRFAFTGGFKATLLYKQPCFMYIFMGASPSCRCHGCSLSVKEGRGETGGEEEGESRALARGEHVRRKVRKERSENRGRKKEEMCSLSFISPCVTLII